MAKIDYREFNRVFAKHYNPNDPVSRLSYRPPNTLLGYHLGIVEDNSDPDKRGRLKVRFPFWGEKVVSNWIPLLRPYASEGAGVWMLPDIGTQVICCFFNYSPSKPVVIGSVYTPRAPAPLKENPENDLKVFTTRSGSRILFNDKEGEERLVIHTKDGKMRLVLDKKGGLSIVNESGEISISCRKLVIESADSTTFSIKKKLAITCKDDTLSLKADKALALKSGKDVVLKGKKVKLKGSTGVTAGGKQIAAKDDQVLGVDLHDIKVPTNSGLKTIPSIPHIYAGKLADKLSSDVTVNDRAAATKDSKSKYNTPGHFPMPPGVKFAKNPSNEGVVSSGTVPSVKINGKEAAVLSSRVKTCNDPQDNETCTIVAIGAAVPLPIMVPGMDPEQFKKDGGFIVNTRNPIAPAGRPRPQDVQRSLQNPRWSSSKAKVGEEVTLSVDLVNQHENAGVVFTVWKEGADQEQDRPMAKLKGQNKGGKAEVKWRYQYIHDPEQPLTAKPKFTFTSRSYRCEEVESGSLEIYDSMKGICRDTTGDLLSHLPYYFLIKDKRDKQGKTDANGIFEENDLIPGQKMLFDFKDYRKKNEAEKTATSELINEEIKIYKVADEKLQTGISACDTSNKAEFIFTTLVVRLKIDPQKDEAKDDKYTLFSTDEKQSYRVTCTVKDDKIEGDSYIDLHFVGIRTDLRYTLEIELSNEGIKLNLFENVLYNDLSRLF